MEEIHPREGRGEPNHNMNGPVLERASSKKSKGDCCCCCYYCWALGYGVFLHFLLVFESLFLLSFVSF